MARLCGDCSRCASLRLPCGCLGLTSIAQRDGPTITARPDQPPQSRHSRHARCQLTSRNDQHKHFFPVRAAVDFHISEGTELSFAPGLSPTLRGHAGAAIHRLGRASNRDRRLHLGAEHGRTQDLQPVLLHVSRVRPARTSWARACRSSLRQVAAVQQDVRIPTLRLHLDADAGERSR